MNQETQPIALNNSSADFSVSGLFKNALKIYGANFSRIAVMVLLILTPVIILRTLFSNAIWQIIMDILLVVATTLFYISFINKIHNSEKISLSQIFSKQYAQLIIPLLWVELLMYLITLGTTILLIVPGIIVGNLLLFSIYGVIIENQRGLAALLRSRNLVKGDWWAVFGRTILLSLSFSLIIFIVGLPFFGIFHVIGGGTMKAFLNNKIWIGIEMILLYLTLPVLLAYNYLMFSWFAERKPLSQFNQAEKKGLYKGLTVWGFITPFVVIPLVIFGVAISMGINQAKLKAVSEYNVQLRDVERFNTAQALKVAIVEYLWTSKFDSPICQPKTLYASAIVGVPAGWTAGINMGKDGIDGRGWLPFDFRKMENDGNPFIFDGLRLPLNKLPLDPANDPQKGFVYTFACDAATQTFELNMKFEEATVQNVNNTEATDGGDNSDVYEVGTNLNLINFTTGPSVAANSQNVSQTDNAVTYLSVPQLGIKLAIPKNITDFDYVIKGNALFFSRLSLEKISSYCKPEEGPFGALSVVYKKDLISDTPNSSWTETKTGLDEAVKEGLAKEFENFYLVFITPQDASCATVSSSTPWNFDLRDLVNKAEVID